MNRWLWTFLLLVTYCLELNAQQIDDTRQIQGLQTHPATNYAVVGARLHVGDGRQIDDGVILVKDGKIIAIGSQADVTVPDDFQRIDLPGKVIYPGLIDAYLPVPVDQTSPPHAYWNPKIRGQLDVRDYLTGEITDDQARRSQGIVAAWFAPTGGIIDGVGAVASLGGPQPIPARQLIRSEVGQSAVLTVTRGARSSTPDPLTGGYPSSPMGAVALARQALYDTRWYRDAWQAVQTDPSIPLPETNLTLAALAPVINGERTFFVRAGNELAVLRADRFAREFGLRLAIIGSGREYRRLEDVVSTGRPIICPVNFPPAPNVASVDAAHAVTLESLMHWDHAPENPARLAQRQIQMAFTSVGLDSPNSFLSQVRTAVKRGLAPDAALKALTLDAARLLGVEDQLGTLARGKLASFVIADGDLFDDRTKILQTWVAGRPYEIKAEAQVDLSGPWELQVAAFGNSPAWSTAVEINRSGDQWSGKSLTQPAAASKDQADGSSSDKADKPAVKFEKLRFDGQVFGGITQGELPVPGVARWSVAVDGASSAGYVGRWVWADGTSAPLTMIPRVSQQAAPDTPPDSTTPGTPDVAAKAEATSDSSDPTLETAVEQTTESAPTPRAPKSSPAASFPVNYPLGMYGRIASPQATQSVLFKDFVVWTSGPQGILQGGSVWVKNGKVQQVFASLEDANAASLPEGTLVIEGQGRHLSPGLIDCHSHAATDSGVNEGTQAVTSEVRIGDFVDCNDITIYRQLAGGLTAANVLHGSANPIGGQNQVIKLRWGVNDEQLKFQEAPQGIKFALGENVKRSNSSSPTTRYPGSRMGVEQIIRDAFYNATEYRLRHRQWANRRSGIPPRIDLELEALSEIVDGQRWIHCHSYRQDEILALIRTLDEFHVQLGTFQHILEGYKVADSMAHHGAMASAFADWWAYKLEVADAIPYAGAIMHNEGVVVSFNSDDGELGRRMNHEAAKAVKYGGIDPAEALKFVTLNPAKQLRVDQYVGSLEVGKHADLVIWSGSPLSTLSRVDQTWIDGVKYFDRSADEAWRSELESWRQALIQKILDSGSKMAEPGQEIDPDNSRDWPRFDEYCRAKGE